MKATIFLFATVSLLINTACAQEVPENVKSSFNSKFPNATEIKWEQEHKNEWEAEFKVNGVDYSANFNSEGEWKETEHEVKIDQLPKAAQTTLSTEFASYKVIEAEVIETPKFKGFEIKLKNSNSVIEVVMDENGKVLKKS